MKYINLGCGSHFSEKPEWVNLDFVSSGPGVIGHNLLKGIPFPDNSFDLVYHSHVLEHFTRADAEQFLRECTRVLKPGGVLRIAIPDLERIARNYLEFLEAGWNNPQDKVIRANYEWMLLEMYDQTVRDREGGGNMGKYLAQPDMPNETFVFERVGEEGRAFRKMILEISAIQAGPGSRSFNSLMSSVRTWLRRLFFFIFGLDLQAYEIGKFRLGGEIHQWMYDKYSLYSLLSSRGLSGIEIRDAFTSYIGQWKSYELDAIGTAVRKPDSLFIEALKK